MSERFDVPVTILDQKLLKFAIAFCNEGSADPHIPFLAQLKYFPLCLPHLFFHLVQTVASITKGLGCQFFLLIFYFILSSVEFVHSYIWFEMILFILFIIPVLSLFQVLFIFPIDRVITTWKYFHTFAIYLLEVSFFMLKLLILSTTFNMRFI